MSLIVADASPLIAFARSAHLPVLQSVAGTILIPNTVWNECTHDVTKPGAQALIEAETKGWVQHVQDAAMPVVLNKTTIDAGEKAAIATAIERGCPVLMDERIGRAVAAHYSVSVIGSAGILLIAKQKGYISLIEPVLNQWVAFGYRLSETLINSVLIKANEAKL